MRKHKIIPNHKKKLYSKPVITVVKLDPAQALLSACTIGGAYFAGGDRCMIPFPHPPVTCPVPSRLGRAVVGNGYSTSTIPS